MPPLFSYVTPYPASFARLSADTCSANTLGVVWLWKFALRMTTLVEKSVLPPT